MRTRVPHGPLSRDKLIEMCTYVIARLAEDDSPPPSVVSLSEVSKSLDTGVNFLNAILSGKYESLGLGPLSLPDKDDQPEEGA